MAIITKTYGLVQTREGIGEQKGFTYFVVTTSLFGIIPLHKEMQIVAIIA